MLIHLAKTKVFSKKTTEIKKNKYFTFIHEVYLPFTLPMQNLIIIIQHSTNKLLHVPEIPFGHIQSVMFHAYFPQDS